MFMPLLQMLIDMEPCSIDGPVKKAACCLCTSPAHALLLVPNAAVLLWNLWLEPADLTACSRAPEHQCRIWTSASANDFGTPLSAATSGCIDCTNQYSQRPPDPVYGRGGHERLLMKALIWACVPVLRAHETVQEATLEMTKFSRPREHMEQCKIPPGLGNGRTCLGACNQ